MAFNGSGYSFEDEEWKFEPPVCQFGIPGITATRTIVGESHVISEVCMSVFNGQITLMKVICRKVKVGQVSLQMIIRFQLH